MEKEKLLKIEYVNIEDETENDLTLKKIYDKYHVDYSLEKINDYINIRYKRDVKVGFGIFLLIFANIFPVLTNLFYSGILEAIVALLYFFTGIYGIITIICAAKDFRNLNLNVPNTNRENKRIVYEDAYREKEIAKKTKVLGIVCCLFSIFPSMVFNDISSALQDLGISLFLIMIALGVFLIKISKSKLNSYKRILNVKNI